MAERIRTSTRRVLEEPTRSNSPVSRTRRSLGWRFKGTFAISSRKSVPPSAISKRPTRSVFASVKAPFTWPNSSLSKTPSERPPALTVARGRLARSETACRARATVPLPVPFSPVMSTLASEGPTRAIIWSTGCMAADSAMRLTLPSSRRSFISASRRCPRRRARPSSIWVRTTDTRRAFSHGFWMKSRAPRRIASTASSMLPQAVITITGREESTSWMRARRSRPSWPEVVSRA